MTYDVRQIQNGKHEFGIIGLDNAIETVAEKHGDDSDETIAETLPDALLKDNYIPANARERFKQTFLREYKKMN